MGYPQAIRDVMGAVGVGLMGYGGWLYTPAAGFIVAGAALLALAVAGTLRDDKGRAE